MFRLSPPSKRITVIAKAARMGAMAITPCISTRLKTGPARTPNRTRNGISGMPVLLKKRVPSQPTVMMKPTRMKIDATSLAGKPFSPD